MTDLKVGDAVGVPWMYSACGKCEFCLAGMETICKAGEATGYSKPGGYAEYMVADAAFVARLPKDADLYELAPILCAGVTTYRGLKRTNARPGQWMAVVGIGGLGHIAVQYAKAMGYRVAAVDVADDKLRLAKKLGAELVVNGREKNAPQVLQDKIGGVHGAIVTAVAPQAFEQAIAMLRPAGTVCYIGLPGGKKDEIRASISAITNWELIGARLQCRHPARPQRSRRLRRQRPGDGQDQEGAAGADQRHLRRDARGQDSRAHGAEAGVRERDGPSCALPFVTPWPIIAVVHSRHDHPTSLRCRPRIGAFAG